MLGKISVINVLLKLKEMCTFKMYIVEVEGGVILDYTIFISDFCFLVPDFYTHKRSRILNKYIILCSPKRQFNRTPLLKGAI